MTEPTTVADLCAHRDQIRAELESNELHVLALLRDPSPGLASLPVGDLLCWCDGLTEEYVTRLLKAAEIPWGQRLSRLSARDVAMVCFQIKGRHPEIWQGWLNALNERAVA